MTFNGNAVGVATFDRLDEQRAVMRGVAIAAGLQQQGHGRAMLRLLEDFARAQGVLLLCVNADPAKTGFYRSAGFIEREWGDEDLLALCRAGRAWPMPAQMVKAL